MVCKNAYGFVGPSVSYIVLFVYYESMKWELQRFSVVLTFVREDQYMSVGSMKD
jgi:hypothetical protein